MNLFKSKHTKSSLYRFPDSQDGLKFRKRSENVLTTKLDSKRCNIFTKTKKLGGLTAVFCSFPFKNKIDMTFVARLLIYTAVPHDKDLSTFDELM
jgi:hypothetical protein